MQGAYVFGKIRPEEYAILQVKAIMKAVCLVGDKSLGQEMIRACVKRLSSRIEELQTKEAELGYREARYGKKDEK